MRKTADLTKGVPQLHRRKEAWLESHSLLTEPKFQVLLKDSLFLRLIVAWTATAAARRVNVCVETHT